MNSMIVLMLQISLEKEINKKGRVKIKLYNTFIVNKFKNIYY